ncbi:MAG: hypothetical protein AAFU79_21420 [Myxococcota bacterium]
MGTHVVYQIINHDREETFFGVTDIQLEAEVERIAKDPQGPARAWKKGETVEWRPLTDVMDLEGAKLLHRELEGSTGREFTLIPTFADPEPQS